MNSTHRGGPAFPYGTAYAGMTLRDYFAAKAMQAVLSSEQVQNGKGSYLTVARTAYLQADAMLYARAEDATQ